MQDGQGLRKVAAASFQGRPEPTVPVWGAACPMSARRRSRS